MSEDAPEFLRAFIENGEDEPAAEANEDMLMAILGDDEEGKVGLNETEVDAETEVGSNEAEVETEKESADKECDERE